MALSKTPHTPKKARNRILTQQATKTPGLIRKMSRAFLLRPTRPAVGFGPSFALTFRCRDVVIPDETGHRAIGGIVFNRNHEMIETLEQRLCLSAAPLSAHQLHLRHLQHLQVVAAQNVSAHQRHLLHLQHLAVLAAANTASGGGIIDTTMSTGIGTTIPVDSIFATDSPIGVLTPVGSIFSTGSTIGTLAPVGSTFSTDSPIGTLAPVGTTGFPIVGGSTTFGTTTPIGTTTFPTDGTTFGSVAPV